MPSSLQTNGPPESPRQVSFSPPPAHKVEEVTIVVRPKLEYVRLHWGLLIVGTWTNLKSSGKTPGVLAEKEHQIQRTD